MNNPANFGNAYLQQQVINASPLQQLLLLLDGIIKFTYRARECIVAKDIQERHNNNRRAMEIVAHLMGMIDVTTGGEAAVRLRRIYGFLLQRLGDIDMKNSVEICDEVIGHLRTMRDAWAQMEQAPTPPKAPENSDGPKPKAAVAPVIRRSAVA
jgi:flagellar protein FliS